jgi:hypothetical protein
MIQRQEREGYEPGGIRSPGFYAHCDCGVCGPVRRYEADAKDDDLAHGWVCYQRAADSYPNGDEAP